MSKAGKWRALCTTKKETRSIDDTMKELSEFLTPRQIYILENHPAKSYAVLASELGITGERVRQLKVQAERAIRAEKRREQEEEKDKMVLLVPMIRRDAFVILRALEQYHLDLLHENYRNKRSALGVDPDLAQCCDIAEKIKRAIDQCQTKNHV